MSFRELATNNSLLSFIQRLAIIGVLGAILWRDPQNSTCWALMGGCVTDLFHAARAANGNGTYSGSGNGKTQAGSYTQG